MDGPHLPIVAVSGVGDARGLGRDCGTGGGKNGGTELDTSLEERGVLCLGASRRRSRAHKLGMAVSFFGVD